MTYCKSFLFVNDFEEFGGFLDFNFLDAGESIVFTFGLERNSGRLDEFQNIAFGVFAGSAVENAFRHEHEKTRKTGGAIGFTSESEGLQIIFPAFHYTTHRTTAEGGIVRNADVLGLAVDFEFGDKLFLVAVLKIPTHKLKIGTPGTSVALLHSFANLGVVKNGDRIGSHANGDIAGGIAPMLAVYDNV